MFGRREPGCPNRPPPAEARSRVYDEWREELYNGEPSGCRTWNGADWKEYARLLFDDAFALAASLDACRERSLLAGVKS
jgi:hypothetical protein